MSVAQARRARDAGVPLIRKTALAAGSGWWVNEYACLAGPGDNVAHERHDIVTIAAVLEGSFVYHGDSGRHLMHPGALLAGNYGRCYSCGHEHGTGDRCIALHVDLELYSEIAATSTGSAGFRFPVAMLPGRPAFAPFLAVLSAFDSRSSRTAQAAPRSGLYGDQAITGQLAGLLMAVSGMTLRSISATPHDERRINRVIAILDDERLNEDPSLEALASAAAMSKFHFLRTFRKVTGKTPHNYILTRRLTRAAAALKASKASVSEIAYGAGFADLSTFNRQFRAVFGVSPQQFRR